MTFIDIHRHTPPTKELGHTVISLNLNHLQGEKPDNFPFTVGLHPWWIKEIDTHQALLRIKELSQLPNYLCMGEMGLDRAIETDFNLQIEVFTSQIELAKMLSPRAIVIHCVRAFNEIISVINKTQYAGKLIFHDYNAGEDITLDLIKRGHYFSFGRHLFNEKTKAFKVFKSIPLSQIFLETDDWSEVEMANVYQKAAELRSIEVSQLELQIERNFQLIFK